MVLYNIASSYCPVINPVLNNTGLYSPSILKDILCLWLQDLYFFPAYFRLSSLLKYVRKVVGGFGKRFVLVGYWCEKARKHMCVTDRHDMTLAVKVALKPHISGVKHIWKESYVSTGVRKPVNTYASPT